MVEKSVKRPIAAVFNISSVVGAKSMGRNVGAVIFATLVALPALAGDQTWSIRDIAQLVRAGDKRVTLMVGSGIMGAKVAFNAMGHSVDCNEKSSIDLMRSVADGIMSGRLGAKMRGFTIESKYRALEAVGLYSDTVLTTQCTFKPKLPESGLSGGSKITEPSRAEVKRTAVRSRRELWGSRVSDPQNF